MLEQGQGFTVPRRQRPLSRPRPSSAPAPSHRDGNSGDREVAFVFQSRWNQPASIHVQAGMDETERAAIRGDGHDPDDPKVIAALGRVPSSWLQTIPNDASVGGVDEQHVGLRPAQDVSGHRAKPLVAARA